VSKVGRALLGFVVLGATVLSRPHAVESVAHAEPIAGRAGGCPPEMTRAETVCIDRFEAHLARRNQDGALLSLPPSARPAGPDLVAVSAKGTKPQAYVSRIEAAQACENAGKRLCSVTEWLACLPLALVTRTSSADD
jgi:hypothetical protein